MKKVRFDIWCIEYQLTYAGGVAIFHECREDKPTVDEIKKSLIEIINRSNTGYIEKKAIIRKETLEITIIE